MIEEYIISGCSEVKNAGYYHGRIEERGREGWCQHVCCPKAALGIRGRISPLASLGRNDGRMMIRPYELDKMAWPACAEARNTRMKRTRWTEWTGRARTDTDKHRNGGLRTHPTAHGGEKRRLNV
jgi:hypothetical protein